MAGTGNCQEETIQCLNLNHLDSSSELKESHETESQPSSIALGADTSILAFHLSKNDPASEMLHSSVPANGIVVQMPYNEPPSFQMQDSAGLIAPDPESKYMDYDCRASKGKGKIQESCKEDITQVAGKNLMDEIHHQRQVIATTADITNASILLKK